MSEKLVYLASDDTKTAVDHTTLAKDDVVVLVKDGKEHKTLAGALKLASEKSKEERITHLTENEELSAARLAQLEASKLRTAATKAKLAD